MTRSRSRARDRPGSPPGSVCTSAGVPSAIFLPKSMATTLSETDITRLMWCSTSSTVTFCVSRMRRIWPRSTSTSSWLSPAAGSSSRSSFGCAGERARQLHALLHRERQPAGRQMRDGLEVHEADELGRPLGDAPLLALPRAAGAGRWSRKPVLRAAVAADLDVVEHAHAVEQRHVLEGAADAELGDGVARLGQDRAALEQDVARVGDVEPREAVEERGLAGAVGADQAGDLRPARRRRRCRRARRCRRSAPRRCERITKHTRRSRNDAFGDGSDHRDSNSPPCSCLWCTAGDFFCTR